MHAYFYEIADYAATLLKGTEVYLAWFAGETSDFCRLNHGLVRQAGSVAQAELRLRLIDGKRNVQGSIALSQDEGQDRAHLRGLLAELRHSLKAVPEDPYLLYNDTPCSSERLKSTDLPPAIDNVQSIVRQARGLDLVGIYAHGLVMRGFANSLGQRNWHEAQTFNFDFSLYHRGDKAVKSAYAGFNWDAAEFARVLRSAEQQLGALTLPEKTLAPGQYRAYLAPAALSEIETMLSWGGFSEKARRTRTSPLLRLALGEQLLSPMVHMDENTAEGTAPAFNADGYVKPALVPLIKDGRAAGSLISARTAKEYGLTPNGADGSEAPQSLALRGGELDIEDAAKALGDGLYINNLWYLNYSDRDAGRVTGMTRFASFWVEGGRIASPLAVMRFDASLYRMFGEHLEALTKQRAYVLSASTYNSRDTSSVQLPGLLLKEFPLTL